MSESIAEQLREAGVELREGKSGRLRAARVPPGRTLELAQWRLLASLSDLVKIDAAGAEVRDQHVALLAALPRLAQLDLRETAVGDAAAEHLRTASRLQLLHLPATVSKDAVKQLRQTLLGTRIVVH